jgi:CheY-like chemotaxis protein
MNERVVLVVEDDEPKQRAVAAYLREVLPSEVEIRTAESLTSAIAELSKMEIAFAVVDMSIPTFDLVKDRRGGGQPQGFGGADILRFIDSETSSTMSVVITQYEEFVLKRGGQRTDRQGLEALLRSELDERFLGIIHYTGQHGEWRQALRVALGQAKLLETK